MSFEKLLRDMIREEIAAAVGPLASAVDELRSQGNLVAQLSSVLGAGGMLGKRGPGRPRKNPLLLGRVPAAAKRGRRGVERACAILGCKRPARSKGYCAAHYQKYRMLTRTRRLPDDWKEHAEPGTVRDMVLPRGRAGAKALAEARKK